MSRILFIALVLLSAGSAEAKDICDILNLKNCSKVTRQSRRSSMSSLPGPATSASSNPATVSFDRGLGIEAIAQSGNKTLLGFASGTGRVGAALISSSLENTFFSNRIPELEGDYKYRLEENKQYKTQKLSLALGARLWNSENVTLDSGIILKRHSEVRDINLGAGLSGRLYFFSFGFSAYQDDLYLDYTRINLQTGLPYSLETGRDDYHEKFTVLNSFVGLKWKNLNIDYGIIQSKYKIEEEGTRITILAASYVFGNNLINLSLRDETSPRKVHTDEVLKDKKKKSDVFWSYQRSVGKHLILGLNYNYFLLEEASIIASVFF
jgi:hypothetical protein